MLIPRGSQGEMCIRDRNIPVTVQHHADDVMGILHIPFILCAVQCPLSGMEVPLSKSQEPFRIIVTDVLLVTLRHQRIITEYGSVDGSLAEMCIRDRYTTESGQL